MNRIGAPNGGAFTPFNIETDDHGNLYVLGQPNGVSSIIVNNDTIAAVANTNQLIKLDSMGNFVWKHNTGFASNGNGCMLKYSNGYIYFQSGNLSIGKMDTSAVLINQLSASYYSSGTAYNSLFFKGSEVFSNGDLLFAAISYGTVAYGTDTLINTGNPFLTIPVLLLRCDSDLNLHWIKYASNVRDPDNNFIPLAIDSADAIYAAVQVNQEMIIGNDTITNPNNYFTGEGGIIKLDSAGNGIWAKALPCTNTAYAWCMQKAPDNSGIFIGGGLTGTAQFGQFTVIGNSNSLPFIAKFDFNGNYTNAFGFLQNPTGTDALSMAATMNNKFYVGGKLSSITIPVFSCNPATPNKGFYLGNFTEQPDSVPTPAIIANGDTLTATPNFSGAIQWYLNGTILNGETGQTLTVSQSGNYSVVYTYLTGCTGSATSPAHTVIATAVNSLKNNLHIQVCPNPSNGLFQLKGVDLNSSGGKLTVKNILGTTVFSSTDFKPDQMIDIRNAANGIYFITVLQDQKTSTIKLIKE
jgi:hypothetical protein